MTGWLHQQNTINSFLGYRYVPTSNPEIPGNILEAADSTKISGSHSRLVEKGTAILERSFAREIDRADTNQHLIALSGGFDSRVILGELLKHTDKENIETVTYGVPGTFNYEVAPKVADHVGVSNTRIDLSGENYDWSLDRLEWSAKSMDDPTILFRGFDALNYYRRDIESDDVAVWCGFMGDPLGGSHLPKEEVTSWEEAVDIFVSQNYKHDMLTDEDYDPRSVLPNEPIYPDASLGYVDQLDIGIRQQNYINPVFPDDIQKPYLDPEWVEFVLNVPRSERYNSRLYREILLQSHPNLFSLPTARDYGLTIDAPNWKQKLQWVRKIAIPWARQQYGWTGNHPIMIAFDKNTELRKYTTLRTTVKTLLEGLERRDTCQWMDFESLWKQHQRPLNYKNFGWELLLLASLEVFYRTGP